MGWVLPRAKEGENGNIIEDHRSDRDPRQKSDLLNARQADGLKHMYIVLLNMDKLKVMMLLCPYAQCTALALEAFDERDTSRSGGKLKCLDLRHNSWSWNLPKSGLLTVVWCHILYSYPIWPFFFLLRTSFGRVGQGRYHFNYIITFYLPQW